MLPQLISLPAKTTKVQRIIMQQNLVRCFWKLNRSSLFVPVKYRTFLSKSSFRDAPKKVFLHQRLWNLPQKENGTSTPTYTNQPRSRIEGNFPGLAKENSQSQKTSGSLKTIWDCENKNSVIFLGLLHQPRILLQKGWCAYFYQDIHQNWKLIW